jgi:hypothetical protein
VQLPPELELEDRVLTLDPWSSVLIVNGNITFRSSAISETALSYERVIVEKATLLSDPNIWQEPVGSPRRNPPNASQCHLLSNHPRCLKTPSRPTEQTRLNHHFHMWSDYAWYETTLQFTTSVGESQGPCLLNVTLAIEASQANAFIVYANHSPTGMSDSHLHAEGKYTALVPLIVNGQCLPGEGQMRIPLLILSESLGYGNLIGVWGATAKSKVKGLIGNVTAMVDQTVGSGEEAVTTTFNISLVHEGDHPWCSCAGLYGEGEGNDLAVPNPVSDHRNDDQSDFPDAPIWLSFEFATPSKRVRKKVHSPVSLFLHVTSGRGHLWLNGHDLGRYWNITQKDKSGEAPLHSQQYYLLPQDWLFPVNSSQLNELVIFDATGSLSKQNASNATTTSLQIVASWFAASDQGRMPDEIGNPVACLV